MEKLVTPKTYAKSIGKSVQWVYKLMEKKEVKVVEIDGVKFIVVEKKDNNIKIKQRNIFGGIDELEV